MISVVIPTFNSAATLAEAMASLIPAAVDALVREVVVADGGSSDDTFAIADDAGARYWAETCLMDGDGSFMPFHNPLSAGRTIAKLAARTIEWNSHHRRGLGWGPASAPLAAVGDCDFFARRGVGRRHSVRRSLDAD